MLKKNEVEKVGSCYPLIHLTSFFPPGNTAPYVEGTSTGVLAHMKLRYHSNVDKPSRRIKSDEKNIVIGGKND